MHRRDSRGPLSATLSQHSIRHAAVAQRIIASTGLAPPTLVIEVGAGDGILTAEMASRGLTVIAVERDRAAWLRLRDRFAASPNVTPLLQDFLDYQLPRRGQYAVVGNVPFAITSAILRHALSAASPPQALFLLVQREAAFRWGGFDRQSLLSLNTRLCYEPEIRMALRRRDFDPPPDVDCVLFALIRRKTPILSTADESAFISFASRALEASRRTVGKALDSSFTPHRLRLVARDLQLDLALAPGCVSFEQWIGLFRASRQGTHQPKGSRIPRPDPIGRAVDT